MKNYDKMTSIGMKVLTVLLIIWFLWIIFAFISKIRERGLENCMNNGYSKQYCESLDR